VGRSRKRSWSRGADLFAAGEEAELLDPVAVKTFFAGVETPSPRIAECAVEGPACAVAADDQERGLLPVGADVEGVLGVDLGDALAGCAARVPEDGLELVLHELACARKVGEESEDGGGLAGGGEDGSKAFGDVAVGVVGLDAADVDGGGRPRSGSFGTRWATIAGRRSCRSRRRVFRRNQRRVGVGGR